MIKSPHPDCKYKHDLDSTPHGGLVLETLLTRQLNTTLLQVIKKFISDATYYLVSN